MARDTRSLLHGFGLLAVTLLVYAPALGADFIWNDSDYVTKPELRSFAGLARIWFEVGATEQYYPFLHSAFWVQHQLFGDAPFGYHLVNVLLHGGGAWLLGLTLRSLGVRGAWFGAWLFALHPVCVESVAWISEQKNTLSLVFYLLAAWTYVRFDQVRTARGYMLATVFFVLALLSKSVTATLPAALLVAVWWQRGRIEWARDVRPLLPLFLLGAAFGLFSAWVEKRFIGADGAEFVLTFADRLVLAGRVAWFYLGKLLWPGDLIFIYPRWEVSASVAWQWIFTVGVGAALALLWWRRGYSRAWLAAALFFGGSLFPVLGFFNVYAFIYSYVTDHWQYLPALGVCTLLGAGVQSATERMPGGWRRAFPWALFVPLAVLSFVQSRSYRDPHTLYRYTLARNPAAWMAHNNLGNLLQASGELDAAIVHFEAALRVRPDLVKVHHNLALCLRQRGRRDEAMTHAREAFRLDPAYAEAHNHLGVLLREAGRHAEARVQHAIALRIDPKYHDARNNLGVALRALGQLEAARTEFAAVVQADPGFAAAHLNLALTLSLLGREAEARRHFDEARRLNPAIPALPNG